MENDDIIYEQPLKILRNIMEIKVLKIKDHCDHGQGTKELGGQKRSKLTYFFYVFAVLGWGPKLILKTGMKGSSVRRRGTCKRG